MREGRIYRRLTTNNGLWGINVFVCYGDFGVDLLSMDRTDNISVPLVHFLVSLSWSLVIKNPVIGTVIDGIVDLRKAPVKCLIFLKVLWSSLTVCSVQRNSL